MSAPPHIGQASNRASRFLASVGTLKRLVNADDGMGGSSNALTVISDNVPCSAEPYRVPELLNDIAGAMVARGKWTVCLPFTVNGLPLNAQEDDQLWVNGIVLTLEATQGHATRAVTQYWIADLVN